MTEVGLERLGAEGRRLLLVSTTFALAAISLSWMVTSGEYGALWGVPGIAAIWGITFVIVGAVIDRVPGTAPLGLLLMLAGLTSTVAELLGRAFVSMEGDVGAAAGQIGSWFWMVPIGLVVHALARFPDGSPTRGLSRVAIAGTWSGAVLAGFTFTLVTAPDVPHDPLAVLSVPFGEALANLAYLVFQFGATFLLAALVRRYRSSSTLRRQQLKWIGLAGGAMAFLVLVIEVGFRLWLADFYVVGGWLVSVSILLVPLSIWIAITRHRLFDVDRAVSRTVVYAVVAGSLAATYAFLVFVLRDLLPFEGDIAVAGSTLAVAALFNPMRRRTQVWVDRRFFRAQFDAREVVERFAGEVSSVVDPDRLGSEVRAVLGATLRPDRLAIWVRERAG